MEHSITVEYTPELSRKAYDYQVMRGKGVRPFSAKDFGLLALMGAVYGALFYIEVKPWLLITLGSLLGLYVLFSLMFIPPYYLGLREVMAPYKKHSNYVVTYRIGNEGVASESELGKGEVKWAAFDKLYRFPEFWLIGVMGGEMLILPTDLLSEDLQRFIEDKLKQVGAKIV